MRRWHFSTVVLHAAAAGSCLHKEARRELCTGRAASAAARAALPQQSLSTQAMECSSKACVLYRQQACQENNIQHKTTARSMYQRHRPGMPGKGMQREEATAMHDHNTVHTSGSDSSLGESGPCGAHGSRRGGGSARAARIGMKGTWGGRCCCWGAAGA